MIRWNRSQHSNGRPNLALGLLLAGLAAAGPLTGCAGKDDVDRSQPDKVDKAIFYNADGSPKIFYYRFTVVEVPPSTGALFEGQMGSLEKVRFKITNDYLYGYRAYDYLPGSQNEITGGANNTDSPIIQFKILSHFDVKREYNAGTGEQTNVISENTSDRPPLQRQYMRLEWSPFTSSDISSQNRPIVTPDYIDVTNKALLDPDYNACAAYNVFDDSAWDCGQSDIKFRHSFWAVQPSTYKPLEYPDNQPLLNDAGKPIQLIQGWYPCTAEVIAQSGGQFSGADCAPATVEQFSKFGFFRTVRQNYDRRVGAVEGGRKYYANRWNIWGPDVEKLNVDGKKVTSSDGKPVMRHSVKPVVYYTNVEWPDDAALFKTATDVTNDWNQAMRETVGALELTEGGGRSTVDSGELAERLADKNPFTKIDDVVILKRNSCNIENVQAHAGKYPDLKNLVETYANDGYAAAHFTVDKLTKTNLVQACSVLMAATEKLDDKDPKKFVWQRNGDVRFSLFHWVDRPQVAGPLGYGPSSTDPETGEIISADLYNYGAALDTYAQTAADTVELLNGQISVDDFLSGKTILDVMQSTAASRKARDAKVLTDEAKAYGNAMSNRGDKNRLVPIAPGATAAKIEGIKGTLVERLMMNNDILPAVLPPTSNAQSPDTLTDAELIKASPSNWLTQKAQDRRRAQFFKAATTGCVYKQEFADDAIIGLALELKQKGLNKDEIWSNLRASIFRGLADHEMGHTMGLRHNFAGSMDALNYQDPFWKIRTTMPESEWQKNKVSEYQYSTVMDYGARFNSDVHGLGKYDHAAIRFGYGQLIDLMPATTAANASGVVLQNFIFTNDYKKLPQFVGGADNLVGGAIARYDVVNENIRQGYLSLTAAGGGFNSQERPYKFCSDEFVGNLDCKAWDMGSNQTEIVNNTIDQFKNYYLFNAYKRGRIAWTLDAYMTRLQDRYFTRFSEAFQFYYYLNGSSLQGSDLVNDLLKASIDSLNAIGEVLETPEPGMHCTTQTSPNIMVLPDSRGVNTCLAQGATMNIDLPDGKPYFIDFSNDYYYRITRAGSLYEKLAALIALTSTEARFFRVDTFADANRYSINYYRLFKDQMLNLLSGVIRNDPSTYGGFIDAGQYSSTPVVDMDILGKVKFDMPSYMMPNAKRVDTPVNKTIRYYALGLALANLDSTWDSTLDISNYLTVTQKGSLDDSNFAGPVAEFTHPESGITYRAPKFSDKAVGVGVQVIDELNMMVGKPGQAGYLPTAKYGTLFKDNGNGTFEQPAIPDWYTAKANLDAAKASGVQADYDNALLAFQAIGNALAFRVDLLNDLRMFRRAFAN